MLLSPSRVRSLVPGLVAALLLAGCGDEKAATTERTTTTAVETFDRALCDQFSGDQELTDEAADAVPDRLEPAMRSIEEIGTAVRALDDDPNGEPAEQLIAIVTRTGAAREWADLAAVIDASCDETDAAVLFAALSSAANAAKAPKDETYCPALESTFGGDDPDSIPDELTELEAVAPKSHQTLLAAFGPLGSNVDTSEVLELSAAGIGIGVYAQDVCGQDGALAAVNAAARARTGESPADADELSDVDDVDAAGLVAADPGPATAALPAGSSLVFETKAVDVDGVGEHVASVVAPAGWLYLNSGNPSFSPLDDTDVMYWIDYSCHNECTPQDWPEILRDSGAIFEFYAMYGDDVEELPLRGSDGLVLRSASHQAVEVIRWADDADAYFTCLVDLPEEMTDHLPAFQAACESARPGWIPVS